MIKAVTELNETVSTGTGTQRRAAGKNKAGGFATGVRINDFDGCRRERRSRHESKRCAPSVSVMDG